MHRILILLVAPLLLLSLGVGTFAHGMEVATCEEDAVAVSMIGHDAGDVGQDREDGGKATPHQHGGCHGHHTLMMPGAPYHAAYATTEGLVTPRDIVGPMRDAAGAVLRPPIS